MKKYYVVLGKDGLLEKNFTTRREAQAFAKSIGGKVVISK